MSFGYIAAAVITAGASYYSASKTAKKQDDANKIAQQQADQQAQQQQAIAEQQRQEAVKAAQDAQDRQAAADAERRQQEADAGTAALQDKVTPTVQLASAATDDTTRKRRANFRPEYASGISI